MATNTFLRAAVGAAAALLGLVVAAHLVFFGIHAAHLLGFAYPLDYGEGPLLAQVQQLRAGVPIWRLYSDPAAPPYLVVNYPPLYPLLAALLSLPLGSPLLAGRLLSLLSAAGALAALWSLVSPDEGGRTKDEGRKSLFFVLGSGVLGSWFSVLGSRFSVLGSRLLLLVFLCLPIVREWAVVMRVDFLGVGLGLAGLALLRRGAGGARALWAAPLLLASLYVKPSLIAAPSAALLWLLWRDRRRALLLGALLLGGGGLLFGLLQIGSGGWFGLHVLAANANPWQLALAQGFWRDQMAILWPLAAAAVLGGIMSVRQPDARDQGLLALYYTLFGAVTALGVGKVGAYTNYFLEFYAGLVWMAALGLRAAGDRRPTTDDRRPTTADEGRRTKDETSVGALERWSVRTPEALTTPLSRSSVLGSRLSVLALLLLATGALMSYYPSWSQTYFKPAGLIEGSNPARLAFGRGGVWQDLRREAGVLQALEAVNRALSDEVRRAGGPIFSDVPGVAAQAGQLTRVQMFEHRQLADSGAWDQRPLLLDLAGGRVPLVVLDYLGNWLTPEMIALIRHRYAQDGSRGTYDLYRPVDPGPRRALDLPFPADLRLVAVYLAPSPGRPAYHADELLTLTLGWISDQRPVTNDQRPTTNDQRLTVADEGRRTKDEEQRTKDKEQRSTALPLSRSNALPLQSSTAPTLYRSNVPTLDVVVRLSDPSGVVLLEDVRPLVYGALGPEGWPAGAEVQHMQPVRLPPGLPPGGYAVEIGLRAGGRDLAPPQPVARIAVEEGQGRALGGQGLFVPAPLLDAWRMAGPDGLGEPLTPAVPFQGVVQQCYTHGCLRLRGGAVERMPLGELVRLADLGVGREPPAVGSAPPASFGGPFFDFWRAAGGEAALGAPVSGELPRGDKLVLYTGYARLERPLDSGEVRRGAVGYDYLHLPAIPYRWP